jgi:hypothetical protein
MREYAEIVYMKSQIRGVRNNTLKRTMVLSFDYKKGIVYPHARHLAPSAF